MNFKQRSDKLELLDEDNIPFDDLVVNLRELNFINTWLGGHKITIDGLKMLLKNVHKNQKITICEIGCGGGDNLRVIQRYLNKKHIAHQLIGIDMKAEAIAFCQKQTEIVAHWIVSDYEKVQFETQPDIIFSSLFCHHFNDSALVSQLNWLRQNSRMGFIINDLHRHWLAYYLIKYLTILFSKSYLVKNDAPLSVARGLSRNEWQDVLVKSENKNIEICWKWAFRWLIVGTHHEKH
jgi:SAM-dependent methyltransferase